LGFRSPNLRQRDFIPLESQRAMERMTKNKLVSACNLKDAKRAPEHKKSQKISDKTSELVFW
jgi:hypothetical protein